MRVTKEYLCMARSKSPFFRSLRRRNGWKGQWVFWAEGAGQVGMGSTAREAIYDARKKANW